MSQIFYSLNLHYQDYCSSRSNHHNQSNKRWKKLVQLPIQKGIVNGCRAYSEYFSIQRLFLIYLNIKKIIRFLNIQLRRCNSLHPTPEILFVFSPLNASPKSWPVQGYDSLYCNVPVTKSLQRSCNYAVMSG